MYPLLHYDVLHWPPPPPPHVYQYTDCCGILTLHHCLSTPSLMLDAVMIPTFWQHNIIIIISINSQILLRTITTNIISNKDEWLSLDRHTNHPASWNTKHLQPNIWIPQLRDKDIHITLHTIWLASYSIVFRGKIVFTLPTLNLPLEYFPSFCWQWTRSDHSGAGPGHWALVVTGHTNIIPTTASFNIPINISFATHAGL